MRGLVAAIAGAVWLFAGPARAHPHIFIDTGLELQFDAEGRLEAIRVVWVYDDFISLLVIEERGLDSDHDGVLTDAERAALSGFDMNWIEGYEGDLYPHQGDAALALGGPEDWTADYIDGRIVSTHLRRLERPADPGAAPLVVQVYDPTFYTHYTIASEPAVRGRDDCSAAVYGPDLAAADAMLEEALAEMMAGDTDIEADYPAVGAAYADEIRVTCGG